MDDIDEEIASAEARVRWLKAKKMAQEAIDRTGRCVVRIKLPLNGGYHAPGDVIRFGGFREFVYTDAWGAAMALTENDRR